MDEQSTISPEEENILLLTGEDGHEMPFLILDDIELDGKSYVVLAPLPADGEDEDDGVMIFRVESAGDGTETYEDIEDERELQRVFDVFRIDDEDYEFCDAE